MPLAPFDNMLIGSGATAGLKRLELGGLNVGLRSDSLANQDSVPRFDYAFVVQAGIAAFAG